MVFQMGSAHFGDSDVMCLDGDYYVEGSGQVMAMHILLKHEIQI
jgi:hypothetical protein